MDSIRPNPIFEFKEDTLDNVRALYDLANRERLIQSLDILEEWVKKQDHFNKKDFPKDYLERRLIACKGSIERTKVRLDKYCTLRTVLPTLYQTINIKTDYEYSDKLFFAFLPKLTEDNERIYFLKITGKKFEHPFTNFCRFSVMIIEYLFTYDYMKGLILVLDYTEVDVMEVIKRLDLSEMHGTISIIMEGYGYRVRGVYIITPSKAIGRLVAIFKRFLSTKIGDLIQIHTNYEEIYERVPKAFFPKDFGGEERPLKELYDQWVDVLSSKEFQDHLEEMKKATINEEFRQKENFKESYMGIPGSFRSMSVD